MKGLKVLQLTTGLEKHLKSLEELNITIDYTNTCYYNSNLNDVFAHFIMNGIMPKINIDQISRISDYKLFSFLFNLNKNNYLSMETLNKLNNEMKAYITTFIKEYNLKTSSEQIKKSSSYDLVIYNFSLINILELNTILQKSKKLPSVLILECAKGSLKKLDKQCLDFWKKELINLGFNNYEFMLNAKDFNLPVNQEYCYLVSTKKECNLIDKLIFENTSIPLSIDKYIDFNFIDNTYLLKKTKFREQLIKSNKIINEKTKYINKISSRQDSVTNSGIIKVNEKSINNDFHYPYRFLTELELMKILGYSEIDYINLKNLKFNNTSFFTRFKLEQLIGKGSVSIMMKFIFNILKEEGFFDEKD